MGAWLTALLVLIVAGALYWVETKLPQRDEEEDAENIRKIIEAGEHREGK